MLDIAGQVGEPLGCECVAGTRVLAGVVGEFARQLELEVGQAGDLGALRLFQREVELGLEVRRERARIPPPGGEQVVEYRRGRDLARKQLGLRTRTPTGKLTRGARTAGKEPAWKDATAARASRSWR